MVLEDRLRGMRHSSYRGDLHYQARNNGAIDDKTGQNEQ